MYARRNKEEGLALLMTLIAAMVILGSVALVAQRVHASKQQVDAAILDAQLDEACKGGIDLGVQLIWNDYLTGNGNTTGNLASYRVFIDRLADNNEDLNGNGRQDVGEADFNGDGNFESATAAILIDDDAPRALASGGQVVRLSLARTDDITGSQLTLRATGAVAGQVRTIVQTLRVSGRLFQGFEYAVLANNINCVLCHAKIESLDLARNTAPANYGSFNRIKVASLESLMIRTNEDIHTLVSGSTYTRGKIYNQANSLLSAANIAGSTLKGYKFSTANGKLLQNATNGSLTETSLANATTASNGLLNQFGNLYMNYPSDESKMTDGNLPTSFPAPFPDDNGNRLVDDTEFQQVVNSADGSLSFTLDPSDVTGSIKAGVAYGVPTGSTYSAADLPTASNAAASSLASDGSYNGNLILVGTKDDPIVIDKKVAVNGDLIIKGPVKGCGQLVVRGNTYVIGDVTYADATGKFGEAADGTKNALALTSGGSIMLGDYLTIRAKHHTSDTSKYPGSGFIDVRTKNKTVKVTSGSSSQNVTIGYFDAGVVDAGWPVSGQDEYSFTTSELMLFNRMEKQKAQTISGYKARYYRLRPSQPLYTYTGTDEHAVRYNDSGVATFTNTTGATIHDLNPKNNWLSESLLRTFWYNDEMTRPATGRAFSFDGLLYSNNSIFGIARSSDRHKSNTFGKMTIRGALVAADLGMLVPGPDFSVPREALRLLYDRRVADFLRIEDTTQVQFTRQVCRVESD